jgi:hypothetical protein
LVAVRTGRSPSRKLRQGLEVAEFPASSRISPVI